MEEGKEIILDTVDPANLLILFCNVFAFIVMETIFFWFVTSQSVDDILSEKAGLVSTFADQNETNRLAMRDYLELPENTENVPQEASVQFRQRQELNWNLVKAYIVPIAAGVGIIILLLLGAMFFRRQPLTRIDLFLLLLVLGAFMTEMYFYFTVTKQLVYIGDSAALYHMYKATLAALTGDGPPPPPWESS